MRKTDHSQRLLQVAGRRTGLRLLADKELDQVSGGGISFTYGKVVVTYTPQKQD